MPREERMLRNSCGKSPPMQETSPVSENKLEEREKYVAEPPRTSLTHPFGVRVVSRAMEPRQVIIRGTKKIGRQWF